MLRTVRLLRFRAVADLALDPGPGLTLLIGENAQGKTTILEAIHYLATGRSFRTRNDRECIALNAGQEVVARAEGTFDCEGRVLSRAVSITPGGKFIWSDDKPVGAISELLGVVPVVVVAAGDLDLVRGAPERRRAFMDALIAQTDPGAFAAMQDYHTALRGRNGLLRRDGRHSRGELAAFEAIMAGAGCRLSAARRLAAEAISSGAAREVAAATCGIESLRMEYEPGVPNASMDEASLRAVWEADRERDAERGATARGPHRDDFSLWIDGRDARRFASQGQCRTAALALRLASALFLADRLGRPPLLLLDDVLGELDARRARVFLGELATRGSQSILTATDAAPFVESGVRADVRFRLSAGRLEAF